MTWIDWVIAGWFLLGIISTIGYVGRDRGPITPKIAVTTLILNGSMIAALLIVRGVAA